MRITNLHLIISFLVLSGVGFFGYQFFGRNLIVPPIVLAPPKPPPPPMVDDSAKRLEMERRLFEEARLNASKAVGRALTAIDAARADGRDVSEVQPIYDEARQAFERASVPKDFEKVEFLAEQIVSLALEAPLAQIREYIVQRGDNLWNISKKAEVYGRGSGWVKIWRANEKKVRDFDRL